MNKPFGRRHQVVVRSRVRVRRARLAAAALAVGLVGALAAAAARQTAWSLRGALGPRAASAPDRAAPVVVDAPEPLRALAQAAADAVEGSAGAKAAALKARFACIADVAVGRAWGQAGATLAPALRPAAALALRRGRPAGILGEDGSVFEAPAGVYALRGPAVDVEGAAPADLRALAREWGALSRPGAFPAPLESLSYRVPEESWQARLVDGTVVLWGRFDWTQEKLARLSEALADARGRAPGALGADLRWFEDGKVLIKPLGVARARGVVR